MNAAHSSAFPFSSADIWQTAQTWYAAHDYDAALEALERLLDVHPADQDALELAARALAAKGVSGPADTLATVGALADAHYALGAWLLRRGRIAAAEQAYRRLLALRPDDVSALSNLGVVLMHESRMDEAEAVLARALEADPNHINALLHQGLLMWRLGRLAQSEAAYRAALARDANNAQAWNNLGLLLKDMNRLPESETACRRAVALNGSLAEAHNNLGNALWQLGRVEESVEAYRHALALRPDYAAARANLALPLLCLGDYESAWPLYEARHDPSMGAEGVRRPPVPYPPWQGESLVGKSILVWPEQGLGDSLQFCRYVPMLKALGAAHVSVACAPTQQRLFETLAGADRVIPLNGQGRIERHDYWCLMMSLPLRFGTTVATIPARVPYLLAQADEVEKWRTRLPRTGLKVGLVWAGNPRADQASSNAMDQRRSLDAQAFVPLLNMPGVTFISLQLGDSTRPQIAKLPAAIQPFDPMDEVRDFADTAAIVANLDLVITVDTSMAHLTGALGKPVWVLSRYAACWRWFKDREDSPWYPGARVFRQTQADAWDDVLRRVERSLAELAA
ncbi:Flp pilus assembly protein TadD [Paraburkholderia bannensis]|uniref:Flp pilus assembly protein TadD n=1 Tax=Paraburkholderia bannensis TaxID=765414 RepID=A0A7W9U3C6_9BURK|nr:MULTISPECIES: tetratricopeptide repeat-containing glycosyltransferase family protein [Paraburkholderia]MBB3261255.1 Flp pilus assembly protein TadD [Paraburkholderia sp. WP4_3_2]MBB6106292.1 Flp pilus assembly protein TadD [Paraburkholderia bannensis]